MKNLRALIFSTILVSALAAPSVGSRAFAAELSFDAPAHVSVGDVFSLTVKAASPDQGFNAAEVVVRFPNDLLEVVSLDEAPSSTVFNFWLSFPSFMNEQGTITFSGGTTRGLVGGDLRLLTVRMRAKGSGEALITTSDASINASDGSGTNILTNIKAARIAIAPAQIEIPDAPTPAVDAPAEAPEPQGVDEAAPARPSAPACSALFANCDLAYPTIDTVSVGKRQQTGSELQTAGKATEGSLVRLRLIRDDGVQYKEITALVKPDRTWEGLFTNLFSYGSFTLEAIAEDGEGRTSQPVMEEDIDIFPPFTLHILGTPIRWYIALVVVLGAFIIASTTFLTVHFLLFRGRVPLPRAYPVVYGLMVAGFLAISATAYYFWRKEYRPPVTFWKDTQVRCVSITRSVSDNYGSADAEIYIDGVKQIIPANLGTSPSCVAQIHTHDDAGHLHFDPAGQPPRLADLFVVAGSSILKEGYVLTLRVNGVDRTDEAVTYRVKNGDTIELRYVSSSTEPRR